MFRHSTLGCLSRISKAGLSKTEVVVVVSATEVVVVVSATVVVVVVSASILEGASSVSSTTSTDCQTISKHSSCKTSYLSPSKGSSNIKCTLSPLNSIVGIFSHPLETKQSTKETPLTSFAG